MNLLSAKLIDKPLVDTSFKVPTFLFLSKDINVGMTNVYSYTFGAPNVVYTVNGIYDFVIESILI